MKISDVGQILGSDHSKEGSGAYRTGFLVRKGLMCVYGVHIGSRRVNVPVICSADQSS